MNAQGRWRTIGSLSIATTVGMAITSARTSILRDSVAHTAGAAVDEIGVGYSLVFVSLFWLFFLVSLVAAVYCAALDMRYIKAQYQIDKRQILRETLNDKDFRRVLIKKTRDQ